jgi:glycosyltransferase involved in cell wall biosynthesis
MNTLKNTRVLHICNDYFGSKVHSKLYESLSNLNTDQSIYCHLRKKTVNRVNPINNSKVKLFRGIKTDFKHRLLFRAKEKKLFSDISSKIDFNKIDIIHATTLFTDGYLAYQIFKKHKKPYIISVRDTDISSFMKYRLDLFYEIRKTIINAKHVVFITSSLKNSFEKSFFYNLFLRDLKFDYSIINNGIDKTWLNNIYRKSKANNYKILYVGEFSKRKNVLNIVKSVIDLNKQFPDIKLSLVGSGGEDEQRIVDLSNKFGFINFLGSVKSKKELLKIYRESNLFVMVSKKETFGLVYIEALTQNTPIIYSKERGVDGIFDDRVGLSSPHYSINTLKEKIAYILNNYQDFNNKNLDFIQFDWHNISNKYFKIYNLYL